VDYHEWQGTRDPAAFLAVPTAIEFLKENDWNNVRVPTAIEFLKENDWNNVRVRCHELAASFQEQVNSLTDFDPLTSPSFFEQMAAARLPDVNPEDFQKRLYDQFKIEIPVFLWSEMPLIRISVQGYNVENDVDRVLSALRIML
jgi:isopenicillin-N epimerase